MAKKLWVNIVAIPPVFLFLILTPVQTLSRNTDERVIFSLSKCYVHSSLYITICKTLKDTSTLGQSGPDNNNNERIHNTPKNWSFTFRWSLVIYPGQPLSVMGQGLILIIGYSQRILSQADKAKRNVLYHLKIVRLEDFFHKILIFSKLNVPRFRYFLFYIVQSK